MTGYIFVTFGLCALLAFVLAMLAEHYQDRNVRRFGRNRRRGPGPNRNRRKTDRQTKLGPTFWRGLGAM